MSDNLLYMNIITTMRYLKIYLDFVYEVYHKPKYVKSTFWNKNQLIVLLVSVSGHEWSWLIGHYFYSLFLIWKRIPVTCLLTYPIMCSNAECSNSPATDKQAYLLSLQVLIVLRRKYMKIPLEYKIHESVSQEHTNFHQRASPGRAWSPPCSYRR
jgi:hypothetical protein